MAERSTSEGRGLGRLTGPPLIVQLIGLLVGALVAAQLVTLLLTLVLPPAAPREYKLGDIAAALAGQSRDGGRFDRVVQSGPPDLSARGWFVSERARTTLAGLLRRPIGDVALGFYTQLPVGGAVEPVARPGRLPGDAQRAPMRRVGIAAPAPPMHASAANVEVAFSGNSGVRMMDAALQQMPGGPPGGFPGGGPPGGGFPGAGLPGGGFPQSLPQPPLPRAPPPSMRPPMPQPRQVPAAPAPHSQAQASAPRTSPPQTSPPQTSSPQTGAPQPQGAAASVAQPLGSPATAAAPGAAGPVPVPIPGSAAVPGPGQPQAPGALPAGQPALSPQVPAGRLPRPSSQIRPPPPAMPRSAPAPTAAAPADRVETASTVATPDAATTAATDAATAGRPGASVATASGTGAAVIAPQPAGRPVPIVRPATGLFGLAPAPFVEGDFVAGVRLGDGRWAIVSPHAEGFPNAWQRRVALWFLLSLLAVAPVAWLFARRIVGPLNDFAHAADVLGRDPGGAVLPLDGPAEIGRAAHAFNQMQSRLRSFVDDRTAMIGAISHDLRTPLTRLRFRIEDVPEDQQDDLRGEVAAMEAMIASVIGFMRDASIPNARERRDLAEIVDDVVEDATLLGDVRAERLESAIVDVDPLGIRRVLDNLLTNAIKYGGGHARVALRVEREHAVADIVDSGPGVPEGELERIFEPFYRSEAARRSDRDGSGLGLAVCRSIARAHGGDVALFRSPHGFTARVTLPLAFAQAGADRRRAA